MPNNAIWNEITCVVPTRNEECNAARFLLSLPPELKVLIVDDSDDTTPEVVARIGRPNTTLVRHAGNVTLARQYGAQLVQTPWVLFADVDVAFDPGYFAALPAMLEQDAVYGPKLSADAYAGYYRRFCRAQRLCHWLGIPAASGSNLAVRRSALQAVGGFDTALSCNEDSELVWRLKRAGLRVGYAPSLVVRATDHRRLRHGAWRKTLHTVARCSLLYLDLLPQRWRRHDWGYWARRPVRDLTVEDQAPPDSFVRRPRAPCPR